MQKFKDLFYDDLSVARGNYFLTLLSAFLITIILLIGFVVSDTHILYGVFIVLIGIVLLRLFKINLLSFKKINNVTSDLYHRWCIANLWVRSSLFTFSWRTDKWTRIRSRITTYAFVYVYCHNCYYPCHCRRNRFRGMIIRVVFRKHLFIGLVVSSLVFASLHESDTWIGYLPYLYSGVILA